MFAVLSRHLKHTEMIDSGNRSIERFTGGEERAWFAYKILALLFFCAYLPIFIFQLYL
jgi:hypothetical protein